MPPCFAAGASAAPARIKGIGEILIVILIGNIKNSISINNTKSNIDKNINLKFKISATEQPVHFAKNLKKCKKKDTQKRVLLAEKEGFEPSRRFHALLP